MQGQNIDVDMVANVGGARNLRGRRRRRGLLPERLRGVLLLLAGPGRERLRLDAYASKYQLAL